MISLWQFNFQFFYTKFLCFDSKQICKHFTIAGGEWREWNCTRDLGEDEQKYDY